jgi:hypothetical protein
MAAALAAAASSLPKFICSARLLRRPLADQVAQCCFQHPNNKLRQAAHHRRPLPAGPKSFLDA